MDFVANQSNLENTAAFLVSLGGRDFVKVEQARAVDILKRKTEECVLSLVETMPIEELADGSKIWPCYKGVNCLFTAIESETGQMQLFALDSHSPSRRVAVTYQSVL